MNSIRGSPFDIKDHFRLHRVLIPVSGLMCSTPFGIKDHFSKSDRLILIQEIVCSTPFGIKDHFRPQLQHAP
ncbi:MAG: hypothetical protein LLG06_20445, partial [Desulfobacteraceae bacterium]|nr:hypothetical protein [Desulfobacteraceae bacterium]